MVEQGLANWYLAIYFFKVVKIMAKLSSPEFHCHLDGKISIAFVQWFNMTWLS